MDIFLHIIHALSALAIIVVILLQQGKGATAGASFGAGASGTMLGDSGGGNFLTHTTAILGAIFMITSLALAWQAKNGDEVTSDGVQALQQVLQEQQAQKSSTDNTLPPGVVVPQTGDAAADQPATDTAQQSNADDKEGYVPSINSGTTNESQDTSSSK